MPEREGPASRWLPNGVNESLRAVVSRIGERAIEVKGDDLSNDQLLEILLDAQKVLLDTATRTGASVGRDLIPGIVKLAVGERRRQAAFVDHLRATYGEALDAVFAIVCSATEIGQEINEREPESLVGDVLLSLHARACLTAHEVRTLLDNGLASGALARARTLHELSVIMGFIAMTAREQDSDDIAQRFLDHSEVVHYRDAVEYQKNAEVTGEEPLTDGEMEELVDRMAELRAKYARPFFKSRAGYEWAGEATGKESPTFRDLEDLHGLSHERSNYRWASHFVHADARGMILNIHERQGITYRNAGPTEVGISSPAVIAMRALHDCTLTLLVEYSSDAPTLADLTLAGALSTLLGEMEGRFTLSDEQFEVDELRLAPESRSDIVERVDEASTDFNL